MNEVQHEAWFYSHEGERIGPVTFEELQGKAKEGVINPRLDLVWKHGMDQWQPAGEIDGLFERRTSAESPEALAPPTDPYKPTLQETAQEQMLREANWPGVRRRSFIIATFIFPVLWVIGFGAAEGFLEKQLGADLMKYAKMGVWIVPAIVALVFGVKRLINVGMSGWWYLGNLIPLLNLWVGYRSFACPSGYAFHKKMDGIGIFLAIVYWLLIVATLAAAAAIAAAFYHAAGSPELQAKIQEIVTKAMEQARPK